MSVDSQFTHLAWIQTDRKDGGLGDLAYPLVADLKKEISEAYGVLTPDGIALRGLFVIDKEGAVQHGFGRSVDETLRVLQAIQYIQSHPDEVGARGVLGGGVGLWFSERSCTSACVGSSCGDTARGCERSRPLSLHV